MSSTSFCETDNASQHHKTSQLQNQCSNKINQNKQLNSFINDTNKISNKNYMCTPYQSFCFDINLDDKNDNTFDIDNYQTPTNKLKQQQLYIYWFSIGIKKMAWYTIII